MYGNIGSLDNLIAGLMAFALIFFVILFGLYIANGIILNKLNKKIYGVGTAMAWIPLFNLYLLGKLAISKWVGWLIVLSVALTGNASITVNDIKTTYYFIPDDNIRSIVSLAGGIFVLVCFVLAIIKLIKTPNLEHLGQPIQRTVYSRPTYGHPPEHMAAVESNQTFDQEVAMAINKSNSEVEVKAGENLIIHDHQIDQNQIIK